MYGNALFCYAKAMVPDNSIGGPTGGGFSSHRYPRPPDMPGKRGGNEKQEAKEQAIPPDIAKEQEETRRRVRGETGLGEELDVDA